MFTATICTIPFVVLLQQCCALLHGWAVAFLLHDLPTHASELVLRPLGYLGIENMRQQELGKHAAVSYRTEVIPLDGGDTEVMVGCLALQLQFQIDAALRDLDICSTCDLESFAQNMFIV